MGLPSLSTATKVYIASLALVFPPSSLLIQTSRYTSIEVLKALETFAWIVTILPNGIDLLKATWFTDVVTTICCECLLAANDPALSILANNSPPNKLLIAFVSLGNTKSVITVNDALQVFKDIYLVDFFI